MGLNGIDWSRNVTNASRGALGRVNKEHPAIGNTIQDDSNARFDAIMARSFGELVAA